jgi:uncharacterized protein
VASALSKDVLYYFGLDRQTEKICRFGETLMGPNLTPRQAMVLAALATESGAEFAPVQVQKLFFLIDENVSVAFGGKQFSFEPYDFGPFDSAVYQELDVLARMGLVRIESRGPSAGHRRYVLTPAGQEIGAANLSSMNANLRDYIGRVGSWVRSLSFAQLVGSIYKAYPRMRVNSVFRG